MILFKKYQHSYQFISLNLLFKTINNGLCDFKKGKRI